MVSDTEIKALGANNEFPHSFRRLLQSSNFRNTFRRRRCGFLKRFADPLSASESSGGSDSDRKIGNSGKRKTGVSLSWETEHYHYTQTGILRNPLPEFQKFRKMELMLNVFVEPGSRVSQFGLRFRDAEGEIFQISSERLTSGRDGNQRIALLFDAEKLPPSWGTKQNRKIDWPLRLFGMTVSFPPQSGRGRVVFESIETLNPDRLLDSVEVRTDTGHPLHLLFSEHGNPRLSFRNTLNRPVSFLAEWKLSDFRGKTLAASRKRMNLPPENTIAVPIPGKFPLGIFYVDYRLKMTDGSGETSGRRSFASLLSSEKKRLGRENFCSASVPIRDEFRRKNRSWRLLRLLSAEHGICARESPGKVSNGKKESAIIPVSTALSIRS